MQILNPMSLKSFIASYLISCLFSVAYAESCPGADEFQEKLIEANESSRNKKTDIDYYTYLLKNAYANCGLSYAEEIKKNTLQNELEKEEKAKSRAERSALRLAKDESMSGSKIFGLNIGFSTIDDVRDLAVIPDSTKCRNNPAYTDCGFGIVDSGRLYSSDLPSGSIYKNNEATVNIKFALFNLDLKIFQGVFLNDTLIELRLEREQGHEKIDQRTANELRASFNQKHKRSKSFIKTSSDDYSRVKTIFEKWNEKSDSYSVQLMEDKSVVTNIVRCFQTAQTLKSVGMSTAELEERCRAGMTEFSKFTLSYKHDKSYSKAIHLLMEEEKFKNSSAAADKKKNISKY